MPTGTNLKLRKPSHPPIERKWDQVRNPGFLTQWWAKEQIIGWAWLNKLQEKVVDWEEESKKAPSEGNDVLWRAEVKKRTRLSNKADSSLQVKASSIVIKGERTYWLDSDSSTIGPKGHFSFAFCNFVGCFLFFFFLPSFLFFFLLSSSYSFFPLLLSFWSGVIILYRFKWGV